MGEQWRHLRGRRKNISQSSLQVVTIYLLTGRNYAKLFTFNDYIAHFRRMNRATPPIWVRILTFWNVPFVLPIQTASMCWSQIQNQTFRLPKFCIWYLNNVSFIKLMVYLPFYCILCISLLWIFDLFSLPMFLVGSSVSLIICKYDNVSMSFLSLFGYSAFCCFTTLGNMGI